MMHAGRGHNILLVDDEEIFLSSLFDGLRRRFPDFTFRTANNGQAALEQLDRQQADLVITDLKMPKMDGFQLIAAMHSQYPAIPLLIMTAHSTELSEGRAMASGALHCIDKPVDLAELSRRIDELFSTGAIASLRGVSLAAFLQLLGLEKKSGIVDVQGEGVRARLYLAGGQVVHADNGRYTGLQAALHTVGLEDVEIHFRPGAVPKTPTIDLPLTQLLLDSARLRDEGERDAIQDLDLAFSESFSDAFDEQIDRLDGDSSTDAELEEVLITAEPGDPAHEFVDPFAEAALLAEAGREWTSDERFGQATVSGDIQPSPRDTTKQVAIEPSVDVDWDAVPEDSRPALETGGPPSTGKAKDRASGAGRGPRRNQANRLIAPPVADGAAGSAASATKDEPAASAEASERSAASGRAASALPIPRAYRSLPAAARAAVLTPPIGRPAMPRPPGMLGGGPVPSVAVGGRPRTPTPAVPTYSVDANVSDSVAVCLRKIGEIGGILGAAFIDYQSGETLGSITREAGFDTIGTARDSIDMVRTKLALIAGLGLDDRIEDIVITTRRQYHVVAMNPRRPRQFIFVALTRDQATLALARFLIDEALQNSSPGGLAS